MVLIVKKIIGKRCDIVLIPKVPLNDMLIRHVDRTHLARGRPTTCIVDSRNDWTGKPPHGKIIKLLLETLHHQRILEGENRYPIPHHIFGDLKCRDFDYSGSPVTSVFDGDFIINFVRLRGRGNLAIREASRYEGIGFFEGGKIRNTLRKIEGKYEKEFVFLAIHIHPAKRR